MNRYQITAMTVSAAGLIGIVGYEGYSATAYKDTGGILTVGRVRKILWVTLR
mgnify:CR=1 FL=1